MPYALHLDNRIAGHVVQRLRESGHFLPSLQEIIERIKLVNREEDTEQCVR